MNIHVKDWCWSWSCNNLATWFKVLTHRKRPWCWERLRAGGEGNDRGWDDWIISDSMDMGLGRFWELVMDREAWRSAVHGVAKCQTQLSNWTELRLRVPLLHIFSRINICKLVHDGYFGSGEVIPHCHFDLHFCNNQWGWAFFFMCLLVICMYFFGEISFRSSANFFIGLLFLGLLFILSCINIKIFIYFEN